jgi:asparagine synthase (glutamine-hydrolysing)
LIWHLEEPFGDLASIPTYIISKMARKDVVVCLNGSGGDELFAGYPHHNYGSLIKYGLLDRLDSLGAGGLLRQIFGKLNNPDKWNSMFPYYIRKTGRVSREDKDKAFPSSRLNKVLAKDIDGYLQSNILFLLDKITMSVSMEGRVPLLDHRFVEVASHLPFNMKVRNGEKKYIFKKMLEPYLPKEVLYRKKEGFGAPINDWLNDEMLSVLLRIVKHGSLKKNGFIRCKDEMIDSLDSWDLWKVACMEIWYKFVGNSQKCPDGISLKDIAR